MGVKGKKKPRTSIDESFEIPAEKWPRIRELYPTVDYGLEFVQFRDYHLAQASTFADWVAAYRTWCRNALKFGTYPEPSTVAGGGLPVDEAEMTEQQRFLRENNLL